MSTPDHDRLVELTVHPLNDSVGAETPKTIATARQKLVVLFLIASLPVVTAALVYFLLRPQGHAGLGQIITPPQAVGSAQGVDLAGQSMRLEVLRGQWLLVSVADAACSADCEKRLFMQRQLHAMLGGETRRVDKVWLLNDQAPVAEPLRAALHDVTVLRVAPSSLQSWLPAPAGTAQADYLYVVDPLGNAVMRFPAVMDAAQVRLALRDLARVLRATASWDGPGRPVQQ